MWLVWLIQNWSLRTDFLLLDNTNYVMKNLILKFRQSSIISEKPGYLSEKLKTLTSSNYDRV